MTADGSRVFFTTTDRLLGDRHRRKRRHLRGRRRLGRRAHAAPGLGQVRRRRRATTTAARLRASRTPGTRRSATGSAAPLAFACGAGRGGRQRHLLLRHAPSSSKPAKAKPARPTSTSSVPAQSPEFVATIDSSAAKAPDAAAPRTRSKTRASRRSPRAEAMAVDQVQRRRLRGQRRRKANVTRLDAGRAAPHDFTAGPGRGTERHRRLQLRNARRERRRRRQLASGSAPSRGLLRDQQIRRKRRGLGLDAERRKGRPDHRRGHERRLVHERLRRRRRRSRRLALHRRQAAATSGATGRRARRPSPTPTTRSPGSKRPDADRLRRRRPRRRSRLRLEIRRRPGQTLLEALGFSASPLNQSRHADHRQSQGARGRPRRRTNSSSTKATQIAIFDERRRTTRARSRERRRLDRVARRGGQRRPTSTSTSQPSTAGTIVEFGCEPRRIHADRQPRRSSTRSASPRRTATPTSR